MEFALDRLKKEGVVAEGVTADCQCYRDKTADYFEENVKNADVVILFFEMYTTNNLDKANETRGWQTRFADEIIDTAHQNGKKVVFVSGNMPYDTARFTQADAIVAAYCACRMSDIPVDGQENPAYGVNYPAALITIFGGNSPTGKLPVDVYGINENVEYTDEIIYGIGHGLSYADESDETSATTTAATSESQSNNSDSPDTVDNGIAVPVAFIAVVSAAAFALRKRRS
jgi:beta-N-acetylhexosaminidase